MVRMSDAPKKVTKKVTTVEPDAQFAQKELESEVEALLSRDRGLQAFALFAVTNDGDIAVFASQSVRPFIDEPNNELTIVQTRLQALSLSEQKTRVRYQKDLSPRAERRGLQFPNQQDEADRQGHVNIPLNEPIKKKDRMKSFYMHETEKVKSFLHDHIERIHQLSDKRIAKAWIKGICPKKQATFPYQNKQREKKLGRPPLVPEWWPPVDACPFIEPDHITREPRNDLLLHLLRLRPSPEQLKAWNNDTCEPHPVHVAQGWTEFLKKCAPIDSLDDIPPTAEQRVEYRRKLLSDVYEIAQMEHDYLEHGMDHQYHYVDNEKPTAIKRTWRASSIGTTSEDASYIMSRSTSPASSSRANSKKPCRIADLRARAVDVGSLSSIFPIVEVFEEETTPLPPLNKAPRRITGQYRREQAHFDQKPALSRITSQHQQRQCLGTPTDAQWHTLATAQQQHHQDEAAVQWQASQAAQASLTTSFGSHTSGASEAFDPYGSQRSGQSIFPGNIEYAFPQTQYPHHSQQLQVQPPLPVFQATPMPEPHFDTVPNTPMFSPHGLMFLPSAQLPVQHDVPGQPMTQHVFPFPAGFVDRSIAQDGLPYQQQPYGVEQAQPQTLADQGLAYPAQMPSVMYGGLPMNFADHQMDGGF
ncbi:hypothetical protein LTR08_004432 [Meristemomyces frigidus]|nr:hypothetical protein LTR08_004432 [Meristemomyces frigidus]